jgi:hypothetical protein
MAVTKAGADETPQPVAAHLTPTVHAGRRGFAGALGRREWCELVAVVLLAAAVALMYRGHFVKPQSDFHEFAGTGHRLLRGELPRTLKRAPLYPVIVAGGGNAVAAVAPRVEAPDQAFAEWFNACLAPLSAALVFLIARRWVDRGAKWVAAWSVLTPLGIWCTANAIVELPLVCALLATIWLAQRGSAWAYLAAAAATMLRYDAAGLLAGLVAWDLLRRQPVGRVSLRALAALTPLAAWLTLTWLYWNPGDGQHYIAQIQERPWLGWDHVRWAVTIPYACILEGWRLSLPAVADVLSEPTAWMLRWGLAGSVVVGAGVLLWRRDGGAWTLLAAYLGYTAVHAVFPFEEYRFAYPMAPLVQLAAGAGIAALVAVASRVRWLRVSCRTVVTAAMVVVLLAASAEFADWRSAAGPAGERATRLTYVLCAGLALIWLCGPWSVKRIPQRLAVLAAVLLAGRLHARAVPPLMGSGREMANLVTAAKWARDHLTPEQRMLSTVPGLLQMYAGSEPRGRFIGFERVKAEQWPEILRELRAQGIEFILWYDGIYAEAGSYYIRAWGLERFERLNDPSNAPGLRIEKIFVADGDVQPNVCILRLKDAPLGTRPAP